MSNEAPSSWRQVAEQVNDLLRRFDARNVFRDQIRKAAEEHFAREKAAKECEAARREKLIQEGTWVALREKPDEPPKKPRRDYFYWDDVFRGATLLPVREQPGPDAPAEA